MLFAYRLPDIGEVLLQSIKKEGADLREDERQQELIGHLVQLRTSLVIDSHKLNGRLFG